jgi:hypothetical protein
MVCRRSMNIQEGDYSDLKRHLGHYFKQKWILSISL